MCMIAMRGRRLAVPVPEMASNACCGRAVLRMCVCAVRTSQRGGVARIPEGWVEILDVSSGYPYYWHGASNTTTWVLPPQLTRDSGSDTSDDDDAPAVVKPAGELSAAAAKLLPDLKRRIRACAYSVGGVDWRKLFRHYDRDNSGNLELAEFRSALRRDGKVSRDILSDTDIVHVFCAVDADGSGTVEVEEFAAWMEDDATTAGKAGARSSKGETLEDVRKRHTDRMMRRLRKKLLIGSKDAAASWAELFRHYDRDDSGELEFDEFLMALRRESSRNPLHAARLTDAEIMQVFCRVDVDGGGSVSIDEFIAWLEDRPPGSGKAAAQAANATGSADGGAGAGAGAGAVVSAESSRDEEEARKDALLAEQQEAERRELQRKQEEERRRIEAEAAAEAARVSEELAKARAEEEAQAAERERKLASMTAEQAEVARKQFEEESHSLEARRAAERRRQQEKLAARLEAKKARKARLVRRQQEKEMAAKLAEQKRALEEREAEKARQREKEALRAVIEADKVEAGQAGEAIEVVLNQRHAKETSEMISRHYNERAAALHDALEDILERKKVDKADTMDRLTDEGASQAAIDAALKEINQRYEAEQATQQAEVLAKLEARHAQEQLDLRHRQLGEVSEAYAELAPDEVLKRHEAEEAQRQAMELKEFQDRMQREKDERIQRIKEEKAKFEEDLRVRVRLCAVRLWMWLWLWLCGCGCAAVVVVVAVHLPVSVLV